MRIYVAGKFSDKDLMHHYMTELTKLGHEITRDWTQSGSDTGSNEQLANSALLDTEAIQKAYLVIAVLTDPKYAYRGTFTEIGYALGSCKKVIIVSPAGPDAYYRTNCFYHHPNILHVTNWEDALTAVKICDWTIKIH